MSVNLADLGQKISNFIAVQSDRLRKTGDLYYTNTPKNVEVKDLDEEGNIVTNTLPNVAKFRKTVWDDVGGALGQFSKHIYVNQISGSDTNDGKTHDTAFKTLEKAFNSIPVGGFGVITIDGVYTLEHNKIVNTGVHKNIIINLYNDAQLKTTVGLHSDNSNYSSIGGILLGINTSLLIYINNDDADTITEKIYIPENNTGKPLAPNFKGLFAYESSGVGNTNFSIRGRVNKQNTVWVKQLSGRLFYRRNWDEDKTSSINSFVLSMRHYAGNYIIDTDNAKILDIDGTTFSVTFHYPRIKDLNNNNVNLQDVITGVIKDSNGIPRNIVSNIVL